MCASVFWEENNTNWQVTEYIIKCLVDFYYHLWKVLLNKQIKRLIWTDSDSSFKTVRIKCLLKNYFLNLLLNLFIFFIT